MQSIEFISWNVAGAEALNTLVGQSAFFDHIILFCAEYFIYIVPLALLMTLVAEDALPIALKRFGLFLSVAVMGWFAASFIKELFPAPRPFEFIDAITPLFKPDTMDSFPSGHTTFLATLAGVLFSYHPRMAWVMVFVASVGGVARVVAGVHGPIDIVGGLLLGVVFGMLGWRYIVRRFL